MRRVRFIAAVLMILTACSESLIDRFPAQEDMSTGVVSLSLSTDLRTETVGTKAEVDEPLLDDFRIAIYTSDSLKRIYNASYEETAGKTINLNAKSHRLVAQHGDTLGCGFGKPYFLGETTFVVAPKIDAEGKKTVTEVSTVAKLANVMMKVNFDKATLGTYHDYYALVKHKTYTRKSVKFQKDETRNAYIPAGDLCLQVYAKEDASSEYKYYEFSDLKYSPNDFVTFNISSDTREGNLLLNITVDDTVEEKEITMEIPEYAVTQPAPSITLAGFDDEGNSHIIYEGISEGTNATANFIARSYIKECVLTSDYLQNIVSKTSVDFTDLSKDDAALLKNAGFTWSENMHETNRFAFIGFTGVINNILKTLKAQNSDVTIADFKLKITDELDRVVEESFSLVSSGITLTLDIKDYNVWATKVVSPIARLSAGSTSLVKLQAKQASATKWEDLDIRPSVVGYEIDYGTIAAEPATTYNVRAIYNGNEDCVSQTLTITTEAALQLGNSGFEEYQTVTTKFTPMGGILGGGEYTRTWYLPYAAGENDPWWACNSLQSMPDGHTGWSPTWCKNFPSSGYVTSSRSGSKAALLYCVNVGNANTEISAVGTNYEGEIWIGTADSEGNIKTRGHAFASRPSKLTFWYKYNPTGSDKFFLEAWVADSQGNVIASAYEDAGPAASLWTQYVIPFTYTDLTKKAATIFVRISSCYGDGSVKTGQEFTLGNQEVKAHAGSFLTLDDFHLIYE